MNEAPRVLAPAPVIWVVAALGALGMQAWIHWPLRLPHERVAGLGMLVLGALWIVWSLWALRREKTSVDPAKPTTAIVTSGPFRLSRNPIYLALVWWLVALGGVRQTMWPILWAVVLAIVLHYGLVLPEERYLQHHFPDAYVAYCRITRRWI